MKFLNQFRQRAEKRVAFINRAYHVRAKLEIQTKMFQVAQLYN